MGKSMLYFGLWSCLVLALLAITAGQGSAQKGTKGEDKAKDSTIAVTAVELTKVYGDSTEGNKKYYDKTLTVEGKVHSVTTIVTTVVILEGYKGPRERETRRVICQLKPGIKPSEFKKGDTVRLQGVCKGNGISRTISVDMKQCEAVK